MTLDPYRFFFAQRDVRGDDCQRCAASLHAFTAFGTCQNDGEKLMEIKNK